mmetsp:Transcript_81992/g.213518  ORF Transcript_81992/g.213518 Transcript_81992/m.213518 type:complete len:361 (-) Transcript_81992:8-1090(-)
MADKRKWAPALYAEAIHHYGEHSRREVARVKRNLMGLSNDDKASLVWKAEDQIAKMEEAVQANLAFLATLAELIRQGPAPGGGKHPTEMPGGSNPIQALLQTFVREWSAEGDGERGECHALLLDAVEDHLKAQKEEAAASGKAAPKVLVPGCGMARIAFDVQSRGYDCSACESRVMHYFAGELIRKTGDKPEAHRIQPFVLNTCNRFKAQDHIRVCPMPEVAVTEGTWPAVRFGEFLTLYDAAAERAAYDAVVTAFAVDRSSNIFRYVRTVAHVVRPGGLWTNFGPLAYDTDHDEGHGHGLELSWEELRHAVSHFFEVKEEKFVDSLSAANGESMMQTQYCCIFFRAVRNDAESPGIGSK